MYQQKHMVFVAEKNLDILSSEMSVSSRDNITKMRYIRAHLPNAKWQNKYLVVSGSIDWKTIRGEPRRKVRKGCARLV